MSHEIIVTEENNTKTNATYSNPSTSSSETQKQAATQSESTVNVPENVSKSDPSVAPQKQEVHDNENQERKEHNHDHDAPPQKVQSSKEHQSVPKDDHKDVDKETQDQSKPQDLGPESLTQKQDTPNLDARVNATHSSSVPSSATSDTNDTGVKSSDPQSLTNGTNGNAGTNVNTANTVDAKAVSTDNKVNADTTKVKTADSNAVTVNANVNTANTVDAKAVSTDNNVNADVTKVKTTDLDPVATDAKATKVNQENDLADNTPKLSSSTQTASTQVETTMTASTNTAQAKKVNQNDEDEDEDQDDANESKNPRADCSHPPIHSELHALADLATKYRELGTIVTNIASKLGYDRIVKRIVRLALEEDQTSVEYYFVAARLAREEGRAEDCFNYVLTALQDILDRTQSTGSFPLDDADKSRLLHIVRLGFSTLMFDVGDIFSKPEFTKKLSEILGQLEPYYPGSSFYHQLHAKALWFSDKEASEAAWEKAIDNGSADDVWNARGTWYKEASKDKKAAEVAYRRGLEKNAESALLMHNLSQILIDEAEELLTSDVPRAALLLNEAEGYLRKAKRVANRGSMRTHVFESLGRLRDVKDQLDASTVLPEVGDVVTGRVISTQNYGAFIVLPSGHTGLLHSSEIDHYWVEDANTRYNENDAVQVKVIAIEERKKGDGHRISLSRKALIEKPADFDESLAQPPHRRRSGRRNSNRNQNNNNDRGNRRRSSRKNSSRRRDNSNNRSPRSARDNRGATPYQDHRGTGATIADILSAKLNLKSNNDD